ncbi:hypothetical protein HJFPF1_12567 [Paramyrothecium foliicola]|nr:hypothetical protein HJFPF1_12567 [Paramyrothecium foliicola]
MSGLDIPYLVDRETRSAQHTGASSVPPPYPKSRPSYPEAINNYYYNVHENRGLRWLTRKRCCYGVLAVLVAIAIAVAIVLSVMLTRRPQSEEPPDEFEEVSTGISSSTEAPGPTTVLVTLTQTLSPTSSAIPSTTPSTTSMTTSTSSSETTSTTASTTSEATFTDHNGIGIILSSILAQISEATSSSESPTSTSSAIEPIYSDSALAAASFLSDTGTRRMLFWQDGEGQLVATEWSADGARRFRIQDRTTDNLAEAKLGTPLAVVADLSGAVHIFYLSTSNTISHVTRDSMGDWAFGGVSVNGRPALAHRSSRLSATWHKSKGTGEGTILSYQTSRRKLHLLMSDKPDHKDAWYGVDVEAQLGHPRVARWDALGHAMSSGWRYPLAEGDANTGYRGLVGVVEGEDEVFPWECTVDFRMPPARHAECYWLNETFHDSQERPIRVANPPTHYNWVRLTDPEVGKKGLAYEFSFLSLDLDKVIQDMHLGVGLPRKAGTDFGLLKGPDRVVESGRLTAEAMAGTDEGRLYVRSGTMVHECSLVDGTWMFEGWVNTTMTEELEPTRAITKALVLGHLQGQGGDGEIEGDTYRPAKKVPGIRSTGLAENDWLLSFAGDCDLGPARWGNSTNPR